MTSSPADAIAASRMAFQTPGARWPMPLIAFLDEPPDDRRVIEWLCDCVSELIEHFGKSTEELTDAIAMARREVIEGVGLGVIDRKAWDLWIRRGEDRPHITAVAQLLFALSRCDRGQRRSFTHACVTPIRLLEGLESRPGEVFDRVVAHFAHHVATNHGLSRSQPPE